MSVADVQTYGFNCEWYSPQSDMVNYYEMTVYVPKKSVDPLEVALFDVRSKRMFLKRTPLPDLRVEDLFIGSIITVFARQMKLNSYVDEHTRNSLEAVRNCLSLLTTPEAFSKVGAIISSIEGAGLAISKLRLVNNGGPAVALQVVGQGAERKWNEASALMPAGSANIVSDSEAGMYFDDKGRYPCTAVFDNCTLAIVRPHAVKAGSCGAIISTVMEAGFEVSAMKMVHLSRAQAAEALEVYKGVLPYHAAMVDEMSTAPCLAMELRKAGKVVEDFRTVCGPLDVEMAKHLRPNSLRARFGKDNVQNAVHATDLEDDAEMEVRYMFELLD